MFNKQIYRVKMQVKISQIIKSKILIMSKKMYATLDKLVFWNLKSFSVCT